MNQSHGFWRAQAVYAGVGGADSGASDSGASDSGASDSGASDSGASSGGASPAVATPGVPIGLSPTRATIGNPIHGDRWPPADLDPDPTTGPLRILSKQFGDVSWSDYYTAIACLGQFVTDNTGPPGGGGWNNIALPGWTDAQTELELKELHQIAEYRPALMAEALAQKSRLVLYWQTMLAFNGASHPATTRLMEVCLRVAQLVAMYYKRVFSRPRPSQLSPWLMPPVAVPGHASYPSGHATEAHLQAKCLSAIFDPANGAGTIYRPLDLASIFRLANRVARNREVLGLHYPSDSLAGEQIANELIHMLMNTSSISALIDLAVEEWAVVVQNAPDWPP